MGCKDCSVSKILSVRWRKEAIQGFVEGTGFSPGKNKNILLNKQQISPSDLVFLLCHFFLDLLQFYNELYNFVAGLLLETN